MQASDHRDQIEQQITRAWREYVDCCLAHDAARAAVAMEQVDRLLEKIPLQRQP